MGWWAPKTHFGSPIRSSDPGRSSPANARGWTDATPPCGSSLIRTNASWRGSPSFRIVPRIRTSSAITRKARNRSQTNIGDRIALTHVHPLALEDEPIHRRMRVGVEQGQVSTRAIDDLVQDGADLPHFGNPLSLLVDGLGSLGGGGEYEGAEERRGAGDHVAAWRGSGRLPKGSPLPRDASSFARFLASADDVYSKRFSGRAISMRPPASSSRTSSVTSSSVGFATVAMTTPPCPAGLCRDTQSR